ncbi:hypothetical protein A8926_0646 [Saccharopolyspora spinosa]|uniref:Uncharacterized protein n=1 Tax=Saccharopolyspora spinosa TaxID=60894 RepID=A0A2N3XR65_SACSN|nr:hypothetical protein A8926_0646 [Saccharopolyspora spinosa]
MPGVFMVSCNNKVVSVMQYGKLGSLQPSTFAQPVAYYNGGLENSDEKATVARCICDHTIYRNVRNEWVHRGGPNGESCYEGYAPRW